MVKKPKIKESRSPAPHPIAADSPEAYFSRELSWLSFARRVLALAESQDLPLLERVKFAGIVGMLHDEFFMKRMSGLKRQIKKGSTKRSIDGRLPEDEFDACRKELFKQARVLSTVVNQELRPLLAGENLPIVDYADLDSEQKKALRRYCRESIVPIVTPLVVDAGHPFPFVSGLGLNLAVTISEGGERQPRFVRIEVPAGHPRWVPLPKGDGFTPLEQVMAANIDLLYPSGQTHEAYVFRVTRGDRGEADAAATRRESRLEEPGSIVHQVSAELKARRFAGVVRLEVSADMPKVRRKWLAKQLKTDPRDVRSSRSFLGMKDLLELSPPDRGDLWFAAHQPAVHPRLQHLSSSGPDAIFREIARGDILLHHPYHCFDSSVLRLIESAAEDPHVLAVKLTIYRTSNDSPIIRALAEAARRGKQVAALVEVKARFDEALNIKWGAFLEKEGVHVAYGVERLKTHIKAALVVRREGASVCRYTHVGTGNYHPGTARIYEDVGIMTRDPQIGEEVAAIFNSLTGATPHPDYERLLVAPESMRRRFTSLIRRESDHARAGRPCGIDAKMNQLQDPDIIRELYGAGAAGVPIRLNIRGLCCLRPGVPGLSETIRVFSVVGRFLEHSRIVRFVNGGEPEHFIGSADWMKRNLSNRVETILRVTDGNTKRELDSILEGYRNDNASAWDCTPEGRYVRRTPEEGEEPRAAQDVFIRRAGDLLGAGSRSATPP